MVVLAVMLACAAVVRAQGCLPPWQDHHVKGLEAEQSGRREEAAGHFEPARDLKPENLMMLPEGKLVVMDFGIARIEGAAGLTATSMVLGTPACLAPETIAREPADHRVDLHALGMILYEMLEGRLPFTSTSPLEQLQAHVAGILPPREKLRRPLPDSVWVLLQRLLARQPDDRFPTAEAVLVHLRSIRRELEGGTGGING